MGAAEVLMLGVAGVLGGALNAAAGGGTFLTFPALHAAGLPMISASATASVAEWPGHAAGTMAYRETLEPMRSPALRWRCAKIAVGGVIGALLLLISGDTVFAYIVPWMILISTLLFALGGHLQGLLRGAGGWGERGGSVLEFLAGVYGGYFGAGLGVLILAALTVFEHVDLQESNALKNLFSACATGIAVLIFLPSGLVDIEAAIMVLAGTVMGGFLGARWAQQVPPALLRGLVIGIGMLLSAYYFERAYGV